MLTSVRSALSACALAALLLAFSAALAVAAPGDLDTGFGTGGSALTPVGDYGEGSGALLRQADGKLLVVGVVNGKTKVARYGADGQPDSGFGTGGVLTLTPPEGVFAGRAATLDSSGGILIAGHWSTSADDELGLVRLNPDGGVDTSFASSGWTGRTLGDTGQAQGTAIADDPATGDIYVGGWASLGGTHVWALASYDSGGTPRAGFGSGGALLQSIAGGDAEITALALDGDKIVAAGRAVDNFSGGKVEAAVMRWNSDGTADSSFDSGFPAAVPLGGAAVSAANAVLVQPADHKIVIAGVSNQSGGPTAALRRLTAAGTTDTGFGSGGETLTPIGAQSRITALALGADGLYAAGYSGDGSGASDRFALARYSSNGVLDTGFGSNGTTTAAPAGAGHSADAFGLVLDGANPVLAGAVDPGQTGSQWALARFHGGAAAPAGFPSNVGAPTVSGTPAPGETLLGGAGSWTGNPTHYVYEWLSCPTTQLPPTNCSAQQVDDTPAGTDAYRVAAGDAGRYLVLEVKGVNGAGNYTVAYSGFSFVAAPPVNTGAPSVSFSGTKPRAGDRFTGVAGTWSGTQPISFTYIWLRCASGGYPCQSTPAQSGSGADYRLQAADVGHRMLLQVRASNAAGSTTATAPNFTGVIGAAPLPPHNTSPPAVVFKGGQPRVGDRFKAEPGQWTGEPTIRFAYGWLRCPASPNGSPSQCTAVKTSYDDFYDLQPEDVGHRLLVVVSASNSVGDAHAYTPSYTGIIDDRQQTITKTAEEAGQVDRSAGAPPPVGSILTGSAGISTGATQPGTVTFAGSANVSQNNGGYQFSPDPSANLNGLISDKGLGLISDKGLGLISDKGLGLTAPAQIARRVPAHHVPLFRGSHTFRRKGHARIRLRPTTAGRKVLAAYEAKARAARRHHRKVAPLRIRFYTIVAPLKRRGVAVYHTRVVTIRG